jgi:Uma2 family endonuclease
MASALSSHPVTIKEYLKFKAPAGYRDELVYGRIIVSPEPKPLHFDIADNIYKLLCSAVGKQFKVAQRVNLRFPALASMPSPDVFVTSQEAWKKARASSGYPDGTATILAVEVLSPGNRKKAVESKVELYSEHGIEAWVVNPKTQEIKIVRDKEIRLLNLSTNKTLTLPSGLGGKAVPLSRVFDLVS